MTSPYPLPKESPGGSARIGRPPQWTSSRSRKLARLYMYTNLTVDKILKVLEDDVFKPRKNSAQKTIHNMLDHDPRYLRPETREEMNQRIEWLSASPTRRRRKEKSKSPLAYQDITMSEAGHVKPVKEEPDEESSFRELSNVDLAATPFHQWKGFRPPVQVHPLGPHGVAPGQAPNSSDHLRHPLAIKSARRRSSIDSESSDASSESIQDLKNRLSGCSTHYATQISSLLRKFTIGSASDLSKTPPSLTRRGSVTSSDEGFGAPESSFEGNFALPGDFFNVYRYKAACSQRSVHDAGHCWCAIADLISWLPDFWITREDRLSPEAQTILHEPSQVNMSIRDRFGNTPLHLFAARDGFQMQLMAMLLNSDNLTATNSAGQTFLHVLAPSWFTGLDDQYAPLIQLLAHLRSRRPDVVYLGDVYGRTFFHRLAGLLTTHSNNDAALLATLLQPYDRFALSRRDAFGHRALAPPVPPLSSPHTSTAGNLSPLDDDAASGTTTAGGRGASPFPTEDAFIRHHEALLRIVTASDSNPTVEDADGRNGLHCLARAIIDKRIMDEHRNALASGRPLRRRPDGKKASGGTPAPSKPKPRPKSRGGSSKGAAALGPAPPSDSDADTPPPPVPQLATRLRLVQGLLSAPGVVDANHYDARGDSVLMAFVAHLPDDHEDKARNLATILETLLAAGARLEGRNRRGETALLVAARRGRKIALATLLEHGANVGARDGEGRGVLEVIDGQCWGARNDVTLYGRLEACRVILTGKRREQLGVTMSPTVVDEWSVRAGGAGGHMDMSG